MIRQSDNRPLAQGADGRILGRLASRFVDDVEDVREGAAHRLGLRPAGQRLGDAV